MSASIGGLNPLIQQGVLNKVRGSIQIPNFTSLNVTASYLGAEGISLTRTTKVTTPYPTMTGLVQSPEPFQMVMLGVSLLRTQGLASLYEQQMQLNTLLGPITVRTDAVTLPPYNLLNAAISQVGELRFNGTTPMYGVEIEAYMLMNSSLFGG